MNWQGWKAAFLQLETTIPGIITAVAGFVMYAPEHFSQWPVVQDLAKYVFVGGLAIFGIAAGTPPKKL
jgi:hypothetical protein